MPLPPLPDENTARYWLDYTTGRIEHTLMVRFTGETPVSVSVDTILLDFLNGFKALLPVTWKPLRARWAAAGSTISLPITMPADLANFVGSNGFALPEREEPKESIWVGRSPTSGRRTRMSLYGAVYDTPANYRFGPGESLLSGAGTIGDLNAPANVFLAIDGTKPNWYTYVNVNYNSYWETAARSS